MSDLLNRKRVLLAEDDILTDTGLEILGPVSSCRAAQRILESNRPDIILMN